MYKSWPWTKVPVVVACDARANYTGACCGRDDRLIAPLNRPCSLRYNRTAAPMLSSLLDIVVTSQNPIVISSARKVIISAQILQLAG
jgi:hypothetical protein